MTFRSLSPVIGPRRDTVQHRKWSSDRKWSFTAKWSPLFLLIQINLKLSLCILFSYPSVNVYVKSWYASWVKHINWWFIDVFFFKILTFAGKFKGSMFKDTSWDEMARAKRLWETSSYFGGSLAEAKNSENSIDTSLPKLLIQVGQGRPTTVFS